jgi:MtfA peptidase
VPDRRTSVSGFAMAWVVLGAIGLGLAVTAAAGPWWGAGGAGAALLVGLWLATHRGRRRTRLDRAPFPPAWRDVLQRHVAYYRRLPDTARDRFEREVRYFLQEHVITGPRGEPIDDGLRVLVAASAVIVAFGHPSFKYPRLRDIIVYPDAYGEDYEVRRHGTRLGEVGGQGPIILSARALREGFADDADGRNVGLHEFAHVLDFAGGRADGVPAFMPWRSVRPWLALVHEETCRVEHRRSILRRYAATNEAEFFAVATEVFFEQPRELSKHHPELYALLRDVYRQDPATPA